MRRAVALGLMTLGVLFGPVSAAPAQTTTPPTTKASASSSTSSRTTTSTTKPIKPVTAGGSGRGSGSDLPTLGEGFPWITIGAVILVAGLVGARLRAASRR